MQVMLRKWNGASIIINIIHHWSFIKLSKYPYASSSQQWLAAFDWWNIQQQQQQQQRTTTKKPQIELDDSNDGDQSGHYDGDTKGTGVLGDRASWFRSSVVVVAFTTKRSWSKKSKYTNFSCGIPISASQLHIQRLPYWTVKLPQCMPPRSNKDVKKLKQNNKISNMFVCLK